MTASGTEADRWDELGVEAVPTRGICRGPSVLGIGCGDTGGYQKPKNVSIEYCSPNHRKCWQKAKRSDKSGNMFHGEMLTFTINFEPY